MKAITLLEPWASLMALRAKRIETRGWATLYRGPLAIHASKSDKFLHLAERDPFARYLDGRVWHLGCILCTLNLDKVEKITHFTELPADPEHAFGDYEAGRYMWFTSGVKLLDTPVPARGALSLWDWTPPV